MEEEVEITKKWIQHQIKSQIKKIAKWAIANGNWPSVKKYDIPEPNIRGFNNKPYKESQFGDEDDLESVPRKYAMTISY